MKMTWSGWKIKENYHVLVKQFHGIFYSKTPSCRKIRCVFKDVKWCFNASWGLQGFNTHGIYARWYTCFSFCKVYQQGIHILVHTAWYRLGWGLYRLEYRRCHSHSRPHHSAGHIPQLKCTTWNNLKHVFWSTCYIPHLRQNIKHKTLHNIKHL